MGNTNHLHSLGIIPPFCRYISMNINDKLFGMELPNGSSWRLDGSCSLEFGKMFPACFGKEEREQKALFLSYSKTGFIVPVKRMKFKKYIIYIYHFWNYIETQTFVNCINRPIIFQSQSGEPHLQAKAGHRNDMRKTCCWWFRNAANQLPSSKLTWQWKSTFSNRGIHLQMVDVPLLC